MGGAYERLTLYTPLISPLNPPHTHCVWGGGGTGWVPIKNKKKKKLNTNHKGSVLRIL